MMKVKTGKNKESFKSLIAEIHIFKFQFFARAVSWFLHI
jgi:hypothetical protein